MLDSGRLAAIRKGCCTGLAVVILVFIIFMGRFFLFQLIPPYEDPKCSVQNFYLPAINRTLNDSTNSTLFFALKLENRNMIKRIYYDAINLTFYDNPNISKAHLIGNLTISGFRQGRHKKATRKTNVTVNRTLVSQAASPNGSAVFRVHMATAVRFRILFWKTKRQRLELGANVGVEDGLAHVKKKGITLKSGAPSEHGFCSAQMGLLVALIILAYVR